jgi:hypothetical protein
LTILNGKAYDPPLATSPKADNSNFLSTPTTQLQHCTSELPKTTVLTDAALPVEHGGKISTMSYAAQVTNAQSSMRQSKNSIPWSPNQVLYSCTNGLSYHGSSWPMASKPTSRLSATSTYRSRQK